MPNGLRHSLSVYELLYNAISNLSEKERRTITNMGEILIEEALDHRGIKLEISQK